jgi:hypothetical protein
LKISAVSTGKYIIPYFLADFMKQNSGIELLMDFTNKNKVVESLVNNEVDFAPVSILPSLLKIEKTVLLLNKLFFVNDQKTKFKKGVTITEIFNDLPLILEKRFRNEKNNGEHHST